MNDNTSGRIGHVSGVDSDRLVIELDPSVPGFVKSGPWGVIPIGTINSYVSVQAGHARVVAIVTAVQMTEDRNDRSGSGTKRTLEAVMVGRFESGRYHTGITTYPSLYEPVEPASGLEVSEMFAPRGTPIALGSAVSVADQVIHLDAEKLLTRHAAVLGTTGSGKSCTVTALLDGILGLDVPFANIVILDANGEYARAFKGDHERAKRARAMILGPEPGQQGNLSVPHWFMDNEDHLAFLRAAEGVQAPLLQRAVADARLVTGASVDVLGRLRAVALSLDDVADLPMRPGARKPQEVLSAACENVRASIHGFYEDSVEPQRSDLWAPMAVLAERFSELTLDTQVWDVPTPPAELALLDEIVTEIRTAVEAGLDDLGFGNGGIATDFDAPAYYSFEELLRTFLPQRINLESVADSRTRGNMSSLLLRLGRYLADTRYDFVTRVPPFDDALARYLRLLLGWKSTYPGDPQPPWASEGEEEPEEATSKVASVVIIDLSQVASDVLENVTALLARLIFGFAQRVEPRGSFPVLVVLEEAHRYIPATVSERASRSTAAFERIAREGRKFGVSLLLATQRPSELSRTVLSQCGTLIVHRLLNPDDQELVRHATPFASREILRQIPGLATQHAVVVGEAVPAPVYLRISDVSFPPESDDPAFLSAWRQDSNPSGGEVIDTVARRWEQGQR